MYHTLFLLNGPIQDLQAVCPHYVSKEGLCRTRDISRPRTISVKPPNQSVVGLAGQARYASWKYRSV